MGEPHVSPGNTVLAGMPQFLQTADRIFIMGRFATAPGTITTLIPATARRRQTPSNLYTCTYLPGRSVVMLLDMAAWLQRLV